MVRKSKKDIEAQKTPPKEEEVNNSEAKNLEAELQNDSASMTEAEKEEYNQLEEKLLSAYENADDSEEEKLDIDSIKLEDPEYEELKQKLLDEYKEKKNESVEKNDETNSAAETTDEEPQEELDNETTETTDEEPQEEPDNAALETTDEEPQEEPDNTALETTDEEPQEEPDNTALETTDEEPQEDLSNSQNTAHHKYDLDDTEDEDEVAPEEDLEIEEVSEDPANPNTTQPKELTATQKSTSPDVDQGLSKVAISKGSSLAMMIGAGSLFLFVIYKMLQPSPEELATIVQSQIDKNTPITKPIEDVGQTIVVPEIPKLPDVPTLAAPTPPPSPTPPPIPVMQLDIPSPPPPPPVTPDEPVAEPAKEDTKPSVNNIFASNPNNPEAAAQAAARKLAKQNSSMLTGGSGGGSGPKNLTDDGKSLTTLALNNSKIVATYIGELQRIIAQGKVIDAVLESAINTDLPGSLRGVVSRDVYSEAGKNILIPKGSRLVGNYTSAVTFGINRVQIMWSRVIRPDGIDVAISSGSVDNLGRSGTVGDVDNHIMRNLSTALMVSMLDISLATYLDKNGGSSTGTTTTVTGGISSTGQTSTTGAVVSPTVTTGTPPTNAQDASAESLSNVQDVGKQLLAKTMAMPPTITVNQGTPVKVYVQRDIFFPGRSANLTRVIE